MLYYQSYSVSFQEVPDETTLVILVADCPHHCTNCHSPELQLQKGRDLVVDLKSIISEYSDAITCVCLMGEGRDRKALVECAKTINELGFKSALYAGCNENDGLLYALHFDYVKFGPYVEELGGLDSRTTNQHMIHVTKRFPNDGICFDDITYKFWKVYN